MYKDIIKGMKKCVLVDHGSLSPIMPINILQPTTLTLANMALGEAIPGSIVLM